MSIKYWRPQQIARAQVTTVAITAYDVATTYKVTIGDFTVSVLGQGGTMTTTAAALATAINASTHPYFADLVAANNSSATVTITGVAGLPFIVTSSVSGGTGTIGTATTGTAATGPYHWDEPLNWSDGAVPVDGDDVVINNSSVSILYGLAQSSILLASLRIERSFTGIIGLNKLAVATAVAGTTTNSTAPEYRACYLDIEATIVEIGANYGQDTPAGSGRIMLDLGSAASTITVHSTGQVSTDTGRPAVRLLTGHASTLLDIRSAIGGVGVAADVPGETSTIGTVQVSDTSVASRVRVGAGTTITNFFQTGGNNVLNAAATVTSVSVLGGTLTTEGTYLITTLSMKGGICYANHNNGGSDCVTTLAMSGGLLNTQGSGIDRSFGAATATVGAVIESDQDIVDIPLAMPGGRYRMSLSVQ